MDDLISRQDAIDAIADYLSKTTYTSSISHLNTGALILARVPSIDVVRHGIWIEENPRPRSSQFYCSVCHRTAYDPQPTRRDEWVKRCRYAYCPNCGAIMDEREES